MAAIVKPAASGCYVTELAAQMIAGEPAICWTGWGAECGQFHRVGRHRAALRVRPNIPAEAVRFGAEQDNLNASVLGPDAGAGTPEFDLFVEEVAREMTAKAGQKCNAIRRILVPVGQVDGLISAISGRLARAHW